MKKLILFIGACVLAISSMAQTSTVKVSDTQSNPTYCAMLIDGKTLLTAEGKQVYADVKLANGTIVKTDCTVIKSDKTKLTLNNGDCIDQDGNIILADKKGSEKDKMK